MKKIKIIPNKKDSDLLLNIESAKTYIPKWYKDSPSKIKGLEKFSLIPDSPITTTATYKKCVPFLDSLTSGYIFFLSQDIEVMIREDGSPYIMWRSSIQNPISEHSNEQWDGLEYDESYHFNVDGELKEKDVKRMCMIKQFLNCKVLRYNVKENKLKEY